jgi:uncharacterized protein YifN (PemK superfamily)
MIKTRLAVVVSPRLRKRDQLCTLVPLSTTPPVEAQKYHCLIRFDRRLPKPWEAQDCWVKADMLSTVSFARLTPIGVGRDHEGKRKYIYPKVKDEEFQRIMECVQHALGLES